MDGGRTGAGKDLSALGTHSTGCLETLKKNQLKKEISATKGAIGMLNSMH